MSSTPENLKYTESHEWVQDNGDGTATVGITDHAQELLGDLVFVELPEVGASYEAGTECAVVESVKAASDVYAPVAGEIVQINDALAGAPETINQSPYESGWLFKLRLADTASLDGLMAAAEYAAHAEAENH